MVENSNSPNFDAVFLRIKGETDIKSVRQLSEIIGRKHPTVSAAKSKDNFSASWAYEIEKKYGLLTGWIMTGEMLFEEWFDVVEKQRTIKANGARFLAGFRFKPMLEERDYIGVTIARIFFDTENAVFNLALHLRQKSTGVDIPLIFALLRVGLHH